MVNHLGPFSGASDQTEWQEQGGGAVCGLKEWNCTVGSEHKNWLVPQAQDFSPMNVFSLTIDLVLVSNPMVWSMGNCMELFSVTVQRDCSRARMASWSEIGTITAIAWQRTNHLGPFSGPSDWSESKELGGLAVGGQGLLLGVKWYLWFWTSYKLDFGVKPSVLGHGE